MPVNTSITSVSSIALPEIVVTAPSPSGPHVNSGNNPQDIIQPVGATQGLGAPLLVYPSDRPKYYMSFDIHEYKRQDLISIGTLGQSLGTIVMPLSESLVDSTQANWRDTDIGVGGWAFNKGLEALSGIPTINSMRDLADASARISTAGGLAVAGTAFNVAELAAQLAAGSAIDATKAWLGVAPNQFFTMLFVSPKFKRFGFQWEVSPDTKDEADTLRRIGNAFKNAMSPSLALDGAVFKFPCIFKIGLYPNSKMMFKYKPAVLESCEINYARTGRAAFYKDPNPGAGENAPEGMKIRLQFIELEFWLRGNHNSSNDPNNVYTKDFEI